MNKKSYRDVLDSAAADSLSRNTNLWPKISARSERKTFMMTLRTRPVMTILIVALALFAFSGTAYALGRTLGYFPGIGLVENDNGIRLLAEPVTVSRDGVSLTISSVFVYDDRVELNYAVEGIAPKNDGTQADDANSNPIAFCGGVKIGDSPNREGNARLQLPDGTVLERDFTGAYSQNAFSMRPVYAASIPADVTEMALVLDCIPWARHRAVPENWTVPFELTLVPAGTVVGAPVVEVEPTIVQAVEEPSSLPAEVAATVPDRPVTMTITRIVPLKTRTLIYFSIDMADRDPSLVSIMPLQAYVIDSQGQEIPLIGNFTWQPFEHRVGSEFEFTTQSLPAAGPLTVVVKKAVAYYAPLYVDPPQATPDEMSFSFDAGASPQYGQTWSLNAELEIAGYQIRVTSARAATFDDIRTPQFIDGSQGYEYGYDFTVEADPSIKIGVQLDIMSESPVCWLNNTVSLAPESSNIHYVQLCRNGYPTGNVRATVGELSILVEDTWQVVWQP